MASLNPWKIGLAAALATASAYFALALLPGPAGFLGALLVSSGLAVLVFRAAGRPSKTRPVAEAVEADFISNLSHEMRTPLNGILGLTQVLLDGRTPPEQRELLEMIKTSGESILRVLNDLFDYSGMRTGNIQLEPREFRLRQWVRQSVTLHAPQAHRKGLEIAYWVEPDVPDVLVGDSQRLRQVLSNLLVNAIKFTEAGEVLVEVSRRPPNEGPRLRVSVSDTGVGIPGAGRSSIFEAFTQGENVTPEHGGLGLGLAISSAILARMGGAIQVESEPGRGSRFWFDVPIELAGEGRAQEDPRSFPGLRALVVDDHPWQREVMARELRSLGLEAETADSAEAALRAVESGLSSRGPLALLFLDSRLSGVDVLALADAIRERARLAAVLLTPSYERIDPAVLRTHGIAGQLTKPVASTHLVRAIEILSRGDTVEKPEDVQTHGMDRLLLPGLRVLLAEDHPINRAVVIRLLESQGAEVVPVPDGREAIERWSAEPFDLVLLDVEMPEKDGLEVAREIRARERATGAHLPIVALTAHARDEDRERCLAAGMDAFVTKPFQESELLAAVRNALRCDGRSSKPGPAPKVLDREEARRRANGDEALLSELAQLFLEETPETVRSIENALAGEDLRSVERLAHRLQGALLTLSAEAASSAALELETAAREGRELDSRRALSGLKREIGRLQEELESLV